MKHSLWLVIVGLLIAFGFGSITSATYAQTGQNWTVQYYNNASLNGSPVFTQNVGTVNFNWGQNAPAGNIPADNWSARFSTITYFNAGTYRFTASADDGLRLYVHGNLIIDTWNSTNPGQTLSANLNLAAGNTGIQVDYKDTAGAAFVNVSWENALVNIPPASSGAWFVQYYNNTALTNPPAVTRNEVSPTHNWGNGSPVTGINSDNWSARWTANLHFTGGNYRLSVRADDGVRITINGVRVMDEWRHFDGSSLYVRDVQLVTGNNSFMIEYFEQGGAALLDYNIAPVTASNNPQPQAQTPVNNSAAQITVNTGSLNVRSAPFVGDNILTQVRRNGVYAIVGRNNDSSWWQIQTGQTVGWVNGSYVVTRNTNNVPVVNVQVTAPNTPATTTAYSLRATANVNIRSAASILNNRLSILPRNTSASIVARNSNNSWWLINYGGVTGWVNGNYVTIPASINYSAVPVR